MSSNNNVYKTSNGVRKSKRLTKLTSKLNCAGGSYEGNSYVKADTTEFVNGKNEKHARNSNSPLLTNGGIHSFPKTNGLHLTSQGETFYMADSNGDGFCRDFVENIISATFVDDYDPPHQLGPDYIIPTENTWTSDVDGAVNLRISDVGPASRKPVSLVTHLRNQVAIDSSKHALSVKRDGSWLHWTWDDYLDDVETVAKAFIKLGLQRFHSVAILGYNAPEWFISNFAAIHAGGLSLGIYLTNSAAACEFILRDSEANIALVENEMQLNKILQVRNRLPKLKAVIQYLGEPVHPDVLSWKDVLEIGRTVPDAALEKRVKSLAINQCCTLIYTSGTTGDPKGVMLTPDNIYYSSMYIMDNWEIKTDLKYVSFLPLSHIAGQIADIYTSLNVGGHTYFAQPDALKGGLVDILKEVRPDSFFAVPRVYEKISEKITETVSEMSFVKRNLINWALRTGQSYCKSCIEGRPVVPYGYSIAEHLMLKIRQAVGLNCSEAFFSGGAQLSREVQEYFLCLNCYVLECYGMSECSGPHIMNTMQNYCLGSVGKNTPYTETRLQHCTLEGHGEICLRGRHIFMGYLKDERKSLEAFDLEGWLHSGDIGCYNQDGFLFVTGRIKELLITAGGENVAPVPIENKVKQFLPIVNHAVLIGDKRKFLSILLTLKTEVDTTTMTPTNVLTSGGCSWCRSVGSNASTLDAILEHPDLKVMGAVQKAIDQVNQTAISNAQRIQKWTILPNDFSIPGGELGPSLKIKRSFVVQKYENVIEDFYNC